MKDEMVMQFRRAGIYRRICKSNDRQRNNQKKMDNKTNNDLQNITQKTKDQATKTISRQIKKQLALYGFLCCPIMCL